MKFGPVPLDQAVGAILAHSVPLPLGRLRKGKLLGSADIAVLTGLGLTEVTVARLDAGDQHEDDAALDVARSLIRGATGLQLKPVGTGRVNVHALTAGLAGIEAGRINALNAVDPMITVATVPQWQRQSAGAMVATVKIISYGVARGDVQRASAAGESALRLHPPVLRTAALIQTSVDASDDGAKGYRETARRVQRLSVQLAAQTIVAHRVADLAQALTKAADHADLMLILTGSATSDAGDVGPAALRAAGGEMSYFGMPVDPGNLLFIGHLHGRPVIGLPGCAKSPALNGADWVMERLICGVPVTGADIAAMGVGGLLKEIPIRGQLREPNDKGAG